MSLVTFSSYKELSIECFPDSQVDSQQKWTKSDFIVCPFLSFDIMHWWQPVWLFHISISGMAKRCWCSIDQSLQCIVAFSIVTLLQRDTITIISIATILGPCSCSRRHSWCCRAATAQKNSWQWKDDIYITSTSAFQKFQDVIVMKYVCLTLILCILC